VTTGPYRRILLVGFMGSGKTTVGREVALRLGWDFLDFDEVIEEAAGASVQVIFRTEGEGHFRRLEAEVGRRLLARDRVVLASGGGWAAAPGRIEALAADTLSVWLRVSPATAVHRIGEDAGAQAGGAGASRPLLDRPDPLAEAVKILRRREEYYAGARLVLDSEGTTPSELAEEIVRSMNEGSHS
jgi:shikimate kinase